MADTTTYNLGFEWELGRGRKIIAITFPPELSAKNFAGYIRSQDYHRPSVCRINGTTVKLRFPPSLDTVDGATVTFEEPEDAKAWHEASALWTWNKDKPKEVCLETEWTAEDFRKHVPESNYTQAQPTLAFETPMDETHTLIGHREKKRANRSSRRERKIKNPLRMLGRLRNSSGKSRGTQET